MCACGKKWHLLIFARVPHAVPWVVRCRLIFESPPHGSNNPFIYGVARNGLCSHDPLFKIGNRVVAIYVDHGKLGAKTS